MLRTVALTETLAGAVYTAQASIPVGARLLDVLLETTAAWTAATAPVDVGDDDGADSLVGAYDLATQGGANARSHAGTDWGNGLTGTNGPVSAQGPGKLYPAGSVITVVVSPTVPGGPTGLSLVTLWLELGASPRRVVVT